jgi:hypothetical protein
MLIDQIRAERREVLRLIASRYVQPFSAYRNSVDVRHEYKVRDRQLLRDYDAIIERFKNEGRA